MDILVTSDWLNNKINNSDIILLKVIFKGVNTSEKIHSNLQIPNSKVFDLKNVFKDPNSMYPNTAPTPLQFEKEIRKLGVNNTSKIVLYDTNGIYASPRAWWLFKLMGHQNVAILQGGLTEWLKKGFVTEKQSYNKSSIQGDFKVKYHPEIYKTHNDLINNLKTKTYIVIDARSKGRFNGTEPEPRKELSGGHIPNSVNLPYKEVLNGNKYKSKEALFQIFNPINPTNKPLIFSCGSGVTACILYFAYALISKNKNAVYDGSWTEWAMRLDE